MSSYQSEGAASSQGAPHSSNPGEVLREARLAQGLDEKDVAAALRLTPRVLGFIETGQFDRLPGETFGRGYIRAYARLLKLDANQLVLDYDRMLGIQSRERPVSEISKISNYNARSGNSSRFWLRASTCGVLAAVMASALWWWNDNRLLADLTATTASEMLLEEVHVDALPLPVPVPGLSLAGMSAETEGVARVASYDSASDDEAGADEGVGDEGADETAPEEVAPGETPPLTPAPATQAAATPASLAQQTAGQPAADTAAAGSSLQMQFKGACWVQISDADGRVLHSALMQDGQSVELAHEGPLQLVIGAVEGVSSIQYRGSEVTLPAGRSTGVVRLRLGQ